MGAARSLADGCYEALSFNAPETREIFRRFRAMGKGIAYSALAIDWLVTEGMQALSAGNV